MECKLFTNKCRIYEYCFGKIQVPYDFIFEEKELSDEHYKSIVQSELSIQFASFTLMNYLFNLNSNGKSWLSLTDNDPMNTINY